MLLKPFVDLRKLWRMCTYGFGASHLKVGRGRSSRPTPKIATAKKCMTSTEGLGRNPDRSDIGPSLYQPPSRK